MPPAVTLDHLTAMIAAEPHTHRCETSPEGALGLTAFICCSSRPRARSRRLALAGLPLAMTPSTAVGQGGR